MVNRLPEKLVLLRKHFGFSQQELADKMGVNVVEYMGWENGRAICNLAQFKRLSTIFQISLDDMLKNTTDILLPNLGLEDSIQIPFLKNEGNESMVNIPSMNPQPTAEQKTAQIQRVKQVEERQQAKPQKAPEKPVNTIHRVDVNTQTSKNKSKKPNKKMFAIIGGIVGVLILGIAVFIFLNGNKGGDGLNLRMAQDERLTLSQTFSVYITDDGSAKATGQTPQLTNFNDLVQVSSYKDFVIGLKKDGTLVGAGSNSYGQLDTKDIKKAIDVAAGDKHTVAALEDGTVACVGDNSTGACDIKEWKNIVDVEAGAGFTLGIDSSGSVFVAGNVVNSASMTSQQNVTKIAVGSNEVAFLNKSQTVVTVPLTGTATNVSSLKNISQIAVGNGFVVGLGNDGKIQIATSNEEIKKIVDAWTGIGSIAANGDTIIAYTTAGVLVGAGNNAYSVYQNTSISGEVEKLEKVTNVQVSQDKTKIKLSWNKVEGADYYEVKISTNPEYVAKSVEASLSIDQSKFQDGEKYTITITAASNTDKEMNSEPFTTEFTFTLATPEPTPTPTYTLTINYVYDDNGSTAYQQFTGTFNSGDTYSVKSPTIDGYSPSVATVEGKIADKNLEITVRYMKKATPTPTPTPTATPDTTTEEGCRTAGGTWNPDTSTCTPRS